MTYKRTPSAGERHAAELADRLTQRDRIGEPGDSDPFDGLEHDLTPTSANLLRRHIGKK